MKRKSSISIIAFAAALGCGLAEPASATTWLVNATFTDGGTVTGFFSFNTYGYIDNYNLQTSAGSPFAGVDFTPGAGNIATQQLGVGTTSVTFNGPHYNSDQLTLVADQPLTTGLTSNVLSTASYECVNSYGCPGGGGTVRFLSAPSNITTAVPEPAVWTMMLLGFGIAGLALRRRPRVSTVRVNFATA